MLEKQRDGYYNMIQTFIKKSSKRLKGCQNLIRMLLKTIAATAKAFSLVRKELELTLKSLRYTNRLAKKRNFF